MMQLRNISRSLSLMAIASFAVEMIQAGEPTGPLVAFANKRDWADKSGKFTIEASLHWADAKEIKLLKSDGKIVTVPLDKMSQPDQAFIEGFLAAEKAFAKVKGGADQAENPFAGGVPSEPPSDRSKVMPKSVDRSANMPSEKLRTARGNGSIEKREAILNGARPMPITPSREFWSIPSITGSSKTTLEESIIPTLMPKPFFSGLSLFAAGRTATIVANAYQQGKPSRESGDYSKFVVASESMRESSSVVEFKEPWKLMAIRPDGKRVAAVRVEGFDKGNDVALFDIVEGELIPAFQFTAGGGSWDELHWAAFLPGDRLATISQKHNLTFWDLANPAGPTAVRRGSISGRFSAEITTEGEYIAMPIGKSIAFLETTEGKLVGCIQRDQEATQIAFSADAKTLAAFHPFTIKLYSLSDGKEIRTIAVSEGNPGASVRWVGNHLWVGSVLYDIERGVPIWTYDNPSKSSAILGDYVISGFGNDNGTTIVVNRLPHDEALRASKEIDPKTAYAIQPGDSVSVEYDFGDAPFDTQDEIRKVIANKIKGVGWKLEDESTNTIRVQLKQGKQEEVEYFTRNGFPFFAPFGLGPRPSGPSEKVQFQPWLHSLKISSEGQQVFQVSNNRSAPSYLQSKEGESTQAAVNRICQPFPEYFSTLAIPPHLLKAEFQGGLGKSKITGEGLRQ